MRVPCSTERLVNLLSTLWGDNLLTFGCFTKIVILKVLLVVGARIFFADIDGRIKCPAYIGCGDTPTRNTNLVNLTELEMSICFFFACVCV